MNKTTTGKTTSHDAGDDGSDDGDDDEDGPTYKKDGDADELRGSGKDYNDSDGVDRKMELMTMCDDSGHEEEDEDVDEGGDDDAGYEDGYDDDAEVVDDKDVDAAAAHETGCDCGGCGSDNSGINGEHHERDQDSNTQQQ